MSGASGAGGGGGAASCANPGSLSGSCTLSSAGLCVSYYNATQAVQTACTQSGGTFSSSVCATGSFIGCCVSAATQARNCYYGDVSLKQSLESTCTGSGAGNAFCQ